MRISTSQVFDAGAMNMLNSQSALYKQQNQLATGRRILAPEDDPMAAAQALLVKQSESANQQYIANQGQAKSQLGLVDAQLSSLSGLLMNVRDKVVQAGNTTLTNSDRASIATELEARLGELMGIANSDNGSGEFIFSGYSGWVKPFAVDGSKPPLAPAALSPVAYGGDSGERLLQVSSSRQMPINVSGNDLFVNIRNGNGSFVTATGGNLADDGNMPPTFTPAGNNRGTALIDGGSVHDLGKWNAAGNPRDFLIRFSVTDAGGVATTTYQLYDNRDPSAPVALLAAPANYTPGQGILLEKTTVPAVDYGGKLLVSGKPGDGDSLTVAPSGSQSVFQTVQNLIGILRSPVGSSTYTSTQFANDLAAQLINIDQAQNNVLRVQSDIGTRQQEIDALETAASDLSIQHQATLSSLVDIDYNKAISKFMQQQQNLQAAQSSFAKISNLSLFSYL